MKKVIIASLAITLFGITALAQQTKSKPAVQQEQKKENQKTDADKKAKKANKELKVQSIHPVPNVEAKSKTASGK